MNKALDPITAPIPEFCRLSGLGRTSVYAMMDAGTLQFIKRGKRTLIVIDSYRRFIERQLREGVPADHSTDAAREERAARAARRDAMRGPVTLADLGL